MARAEGELHGERRILLIADLSGYTGYLMAGEVEEAPLIAGHLVETMLAQLSGDFEVAGLEGDAVFVHAPIDALTGDGLIAAIGRTHRAFRQRLESLRQATTCGCEACRRAPTLDVKFFVHAGEGMRQRILGRDELAGRDVILVHRLLKDSEPARDGLHRFALITDAAVRALRIDPEAHGLRPVSQRYEHLGEIPGWTGDPEEWSRRASPSTTPESALDAPALRIDRLLPLPKGAVWDLLTVPELRERWEGIDRIEEETSATGRGVGTLSRCIARHLSTMEELIDWNPPMTFTRRLREVDGEIVVVHRLTDAGRKTRLTITWHPTDGAPLSPRTTRELRRSFRRLTRTAAALSG